MAAKKFDPELQRILRRLWLAEEALLRIYRRLFHVMPGDLRAEMTEIAREIVQLGDHASPNRAGGADADRR